MPTKTLKDKKTKMQFVAHGDYSGIASFWTKSPSFFEGYLIFFLGFPGFLMCLFHDFSRNT
jgi:hypothetical protein